MNEDFHNVTSNSDPITPRLYPSIEPRPFYNIAHMSNSIKKTLDNLARGANAVEVDITFKKDDIYLYHGYPCDCFRFCWDKELLSKYLNFVQQATIPGNPNYLPGFTVLYFDIKLKHFNNEKKYQQGSRFANYLAKYFFIEFPIRSTIKLLVAISYASDLDFIIGFIERLKELNIYESVKNYIGYDIGIETDIQRIQLIWRELNVTNVWQGEGITNCFNPIIEHKLEDLIRIRDSENSYFNKVYRWTIDLTHSIKSILSYQIDGIMTNHPERVARILRNNPSFSQSYRLATIHDNPFVKFDKQLLRRTPLLSQAPNYSKIVTIFNDFKDSFRYYIREILHSLLG